MKEKIKQIKERFDLELKDVKNSNELESLRVAFLGKKGEVSLLFEEFRSVPASEKKELGKLINELKNDCESQILAKKQQLIDKANEQEIENAKPIDFTLPAKTNTGSLHPRTIILKELEDVFVSMGFVVEDGFEVETEYNNFDAVNVPANHPARDMQDTFWLDNGQVLKTHTSAAQNRILKKYGPHCRAIFPGRCFRNESLDAGHENTFFQMEGIVVDKVVSVANLIYFMKQMLKGVFKKDVNVRLRPGFFPFTEPSFELDASCTFCGGKGCASCGGSGWIELCPCGMIHPNVLKNAGIDPESYSGFAFGLGLDRLVMLKSGLNDIRHLNAGNINLLKQFGIKL